MKNSRTKKVTATPKPAIVTLTRPVSVRIEELFAEVDRELDFVGASIEDVAGGDTANYAINSARACLLAARGHLREVRDEMPLLAAEVK